MAKETFKTMIGGQALIEGIMMRGPKKDAIVVRTPEGLQTEVMDRKIRPKSSPLSWPFLRGPVNFFDAQFVGVKALMKSADLNPEATTEESSKFDRWLEENLQQMPQALVLHPGCGLDSRCCRVVSRGRGWYDVDFPQVIHERKKYFSEGEDYRMIPADVRQENWLDAIPRGGDALVVMEGLSMYLPIEQLKLQKAASIETA